MAKSLPRKRYFYDTEFIDDGVTIGLLSIGVVDEDGREFYAINFNSNVMFRAVQHDWLRANVLPHLPVTVISPATAEGMISPPSWKWEWDTTHPDYPRVTAHAQIARDLLAFLDPDNCQPELWAYYGAYDHVAYAQLFGPMANLPHGLPMATRDLLHLWEDCGKPPLPVLENDRAHDALRDARWNVALWRVCEEARRRG